MKTKFDIEQMVWAMKNDKPVLCSVFVINITWQNIVLYTLFTEDEQTLSDVTENSIGGTKDELKAIIFGE